MRKLPRFEAKVPRFSPKPPRPKPKVPRSRSKLPRPTPTDPKDPTDPPRSKTATRRPASCHRPRPCPEMYPQRGARFSRPLRSSQSILVDPSWRENSRSEAEAARCGIMRRFTGRSCAASSLSLDKGATPAGGGKPSAAVFRRACLAENRRARFWAASPPALPPTSREIR